MESEEDNSAEQDAAVVTKENEQSSANQNRGLWWKEENWPRLKKSLVELMNSTVDVVCEYL